MPKTIARRKSQKAEYIHNDLANAALHIKCRIADKLIQNDMSAISLESMAYTVMLAFTFEAMLNFMGHKLMPDWKERKGAEYKRNRIFKQLKMNPDMGRRPYSTIDELRSFRNHVAHGKPLETSIDEFVEVQDNDSHSSIDLRTTWESLCRPENVFARSNDIDQIWREMLQASGIELFDTLSGGSHTITLVRQNQQE